MGLFDMIKKVQVEVAEKEVMEAKLMQHEAKLIHHEMMLQQEKLKMAMQAQVIQAANPVYVQSGSGLGYYGNGGSAVTVSAGPLTYSNVAANTGPVTYSSTAYTTSAVGVPLTYNTGPNSGFGSHGWVNVPYTPAGQPPVVHKSVEMVMYDFDGVGHTLLIDTQYLQLMTQISEQMLAWSRSRRVFPEPDFDLTDLERAEALMEELDAQQESPKAQSAAA